MKEYQYLIGKVVIAGVIIANAIEVAGGNIGSQITSALATY